MACTQAARPHQTLNGELIVDRAIALIERDGPGALSMRRLGAELDVEGMAIYHYFRGREELLAAIAERLLGPLGGLDLDCDWSEACRRFAVTLREIARARPGTFQLLGMQPLDGQGALNAVERLLEALVQAGFSAPKALAVYRAAVSYARGYALAEATGFTVDASRPDGRRRLGSLPADAFPILAGRAAELAALEVDEAFERGLTALLVGFAAEAGAGPSGSGR
jgi:AcrR family transcriptional regulator